MAVGFARQEHEAGGVGPDFLDHVGQGLELAGPGGHGDLFAALKQVDELHQNDLEAGLGVAPQGRDAGLHARHVAVVVGAPDVHHHVEAPAELVGMVGDVRGEVGQFAARLDQHPVLVVAKGGGGEPEGPVLVVGQLLVAKFVKRGVHGPGGEQRRFREPDVVVDPEVFQVLLDAGQDFLFAVQAADVGGFGFGHFQKLAAVGVHHVLGQGNDVLAPVVVLGLGHGLAEEFLVAVEDGHAQDAHLTAGVVDVVFGLHGEAGGPQHPGQAVAHGRAASVADVQRSGGVGRDEFHLDFHALADVEQAVAVAGLGHVANRLLPEGRREGDIEKPRAGDFDRGQPGIGGQGMAQGLGQFPGRLLGRLGGHHGHVGGQIAVGLVTGRLDGGLDRPSDALIFQGAGQQFPQNGCGAHGIRPPKRRRRRAWPRKRPCRVRRIP